MGLAQEVACSAPLASSPPLPALLGLLGVLHLYDRVQTLLGSVAPRGVIHFIKGLQKDSHGGASVVARARGLAGAVWPASGAMTTVIKAVNRAYKLEDTRPFWQKRPITVELVVATAATLIGSSS